MVAGEIIRFAMSAAFAAQRGLPGHIRAPS
jgi:hypothetical protein